MAVAEERTPALRKARTTDELQRLGWFERLLLRLFEFLASIKLAVLLMFWLMVECTVGTFVESQVNTPAAGYFVYKTFRFKLLLALLATCVLCAALIRFPWKRYQTGFLITHLGLLVILGGSMMTSMNSVDALMPVEQGKTESRIYDTSHECLFVSTSNSRSVERGERREIQIPVQFGPFTWGHKIFGRFAWRRNHVEEYKLENGDLIRVKMFFANCEPETVYVPADAGPPAIQFQLTNPQRAIDFRQWVAAGADGLSGAQDFGMGRVLLWRLGTKAEIDHFVEGALLKDAPGLWGTLAYSFGGKHYRISVAELREKPVRIDEANVVVRLANYYPNAKLDPNRNDWMTDGDEPRNPLLRLAVKVGDGPEKEFLTFGRHHEFDSLLSRRQGTEHLFTYYPADPDAVIEIAATPTGIAGYRAFGSNGLIAAAHLEPGKEMPAWAGMKFVATEILGSSRTEQALRGRSLPKGQPGRPGIVLEYVAGGQSRRFALPRDAAVSGVVGDRVVALRYGVQEADLPFSIRLDEFEEPKNPGTQQAAMYTSKVTLIDKQQNIERPQVITMNYPLYHRDVAGNSFTLYQSGIDHSTGKPISTYTVARDPGLQIKYIGSILLVFGTFLMFYMGGYFKKSADHVAAMRESGGRRMEFADRLHDRNGTTKSEPAWTKFGG